MICKKNIFLAFLVLSLVNVSAQKAKTFTVLSPDKKIEVVVNAGAKTTWSLKYNNEVVLTPSAISLTLDNGEVLGNNATVSTSKMTSINSSFKTPIYKKKLVIDNYNQLTVTCKGGYGIVVRVYKDGAAYRFFTSRKDMLTIQSEQAEFNFGQDYKTLIPYVNDLRGKEQYIQSYEALYTKQTLAKVYKDSLGFLPVLVDAEKIKAVILEADLEEYPGMFISGTGGNGLKADFAPFPVEFFQGGYNKLNTMVSKRAPYIAKVNGTRNFPWRAMVISDKDAALANNDMIQKLSTPSRVADESWIKPGKVAWDWWNDWNISHVDFRAGINTATYKYYVDFAAANKLEYIIIDEGWSDDMDLMKVSDKMNLKEIIDYGKQKNVGVILWAGWYAVDQKMEEAFSKYAAMGVKGFKIDFMDRDDQPMVSSLYKIAASAADHHLLIDYHGMYKPTGLQRTYPNVVNFEGVKGLENSKWAVKDNVPEYDATIPFIRMMAGPIDYTPGAMRNATKAGFRPDGSMPMSQGTRSHQLALYVIFEAPLQMLADNPTAYMKEQESTDFITKVPTVFDETVALDGKVGEHVAIARQKNNDWFVGAISNWDERDINIDFSFLGAGNYEATIFKDGINADRDATDYKKEIKTITAADKLTFHLAPGGGVAIRLTKL